MRLLSRFVHMLNKPLIILAGIALLGMIFLTCTHVFLRLFGRHVFGTYELMCFFLAVSAALALAYTQMRKSHIAVDILLLSYGPRLRRVIGALNAIITSIFFAIITWQLVKYGNVLRETGDITDTLRIIFYPFVYASAAGCGVFSLLCLDEFLRCIFPQKESQN